ncbi:hypothetical protein AVEN_37283-1, partial [Araneus ventricosus]
MALVAPDGRARSADRKARSDRSKLALPGGSMQIGLQCHVDLLLSPLVECRCEQLIVPGCDGSRYERRFVSGNLKQNVG